MAFEGGWTHKQSPRVLILDDEVNIRTALGMSLEAIGCKVTGAATSAEAFTALRQEPMDLLFLDLRLGEENGLELLSKILVDHPDLFVVVITAYASFDTAVEAIKRGAQDYLPKPFTPAQIRRLVEQLTQKRALLRRALDLEDRLRREVPEARLESNSPRMLEVLQIVDRAASTDVPVLLRGESGTGKEVLARTLAAKSTRANLPFVVINCPTLSEDLLASELFGHTKGAFTGALQNRPGRVETAEGGTLFLDEIGELPPSLQAKLLRFLQNKEFERVGENLTRTADVRVIAATNRDLEADIQTGRFRDDLYYRLSVLEVTLPALREKPEDILPLAHHFLEFFARARATRRNLPRLSENAEIVLTRYAWPGNIRELRNAVERAIVLSTNDIIEPRDFPERIASAVRDAHPHLGGNFTLEQITEEHIQRVCQRVPTLQEAASIMGIDVSTLWRRRKKKK